MNNGPDARHSPMTDKHVKNMSKTPSIENQLVFHRA
jgi:hypothetical protein